MKVIRTTEFHIEEKTAIAFGKFDGVHLGHRLLLDTVLQNAKKYGLKSLVFTFSPSPLQFFGKGNEKELSTPEEKREIFEKLGFDYLVEFPLTKETAATEPEAFVREYLVKKMNVKMLFSGEDVSFGKMGAGNALLLKRMAGVYGYETECIEKLKADGKEISSSRIRSLLSDGSMEKATELLGEPFSLKSRAVSPFQIRKDGAFTVIPFTPEEEKLLPAPGLYEAEALFGSAKKSCVYEVREGKRTGILSVTDFSPEMCGKDILLSVLHRK